MRVAELLAEHTPGDFAKKTVLVNSGAEAVENGVKIARKFTDATAWPCSTTPTTAAPTSPWP